MDNVALKVKKLPPLYLFHCSLEYNPFDLRLHGNTATITKKIQHSDKELTEQRFLYQHHPVIIL